MRIQELGKIGVKNMGKFRNIADNFVNFGCEIDGNGLDSDTAKEFMTETFSLGMAMGEAVVKKQYILTGVVVGVAGTVVTSKISKIFKKKLEEEVVELVKDESEEWHLNIKPRVQKKLDKYRNNKENR